MLIKQKLNVSTRDTLSVYMTCFREMDEETNISSNTVLVCTFIMSLMYVLYYIFNVCTYYITIYCSAAWRIIECYVTV